MYFLFLLKECCFLAIYRLRMAVLSDALLSGEAAKACPKHARTSSEAPISSQFRCPLPPPCYAVKIISRYKSYLAIKNYLGIKNCLVIKQLFRDKKLSELSRDKKISRDKKKLSRDKNLSPDKKKYLGIKNYLGMKYYLKIRKHHGITMLSQVNIITG